MTHVQAANNYIKSVLSGKKPACKWEILACQRQKNDLEASKKPSYPYRFDKDKAEKICKFIENLPHTKGIWAARNELIKMELWQSFLYTTVYGWVNKVTGFRRFREAYIEVPRKNGKSILGAGTGNYMFCADGEFGAEVYSGAATEKQAWEVFRPAKLMVERDLEMKDHFGIQINAKTLNIPSDMSRFEPVIGKPGDGASPSCAIIDEFHEHDTDALYSTMKTGMGSRSQPLAWIITTAGSNLAGPCYALRGDITKILEGSYDAPDVFGIIYTIDDTDDWTTEAALIKANPNYGVSVSSEFLLSEQKKAIQSAHAQNNFKTKHLNIWCSAKSAYYNLQELAKCADPKLDELDFAGEECIIGLDLASKVDIAAKAKLFLRDGHYYAFMRLYIPEDTANDPRNKMYLAWSHDKYLAITPGSMIDYDYIEDDIRDDAVKHTIKEVPYDPWNATQLAGHMMNENIEMVEYRMTVQNFSEPMKRLDALIKAGRFHYDGNPVLTWMFSNVTGKLDNKDNVFPCKERVENKIDGCVAIMAALGRWIVQDDNGGSSYEGLTADEIKARMCL